MELSAPARRKVIFVVSEDYYFVSHRLGLASYLRARGWDIVVATQLGGGHEARQITGAGLQLKSIPLKRGALFAFSDVRYFFSLMELYSKERPDIVHHVAMKPVLWGGIAAVFCRSARVVNALAGMGYLFTSGRLVVLLVRWVIVWAFSLLLSRDNTLLILQNRGDLDEVKNRIGIPPNKVRLIQGAGVDVARFIPVIHVHREVPIVVMVSRMLRDKGVAELVEAAQLLRNAGIVVRIELVGGIDAGNPNSFSDAEMRAFQERGHVSWLGHKTNIPEIYGSADIAVLPSYREGLPKTLLEAAACGLPIVTTDTPGCREVVMDEFNGLLVPVADSRALARALSRLVADWKLRARFGANGRRRAETEFRQELIWAQTEAVYEELLNANKT